MRLTRTGVWHTSDNCLIDPGVLRIHADGTLMMAGRKGETSYCTVSLDEDLRSQAYDVTGMTSYRVKITN